MSSCPMPLAISGAHVCPAAPNQGPGRPILQTTQPAPSTWTSLPDEVLVNVARCAAEAAYKPEEFSPYARERMLPGSGLAAEEVLRSPSPTAQLAVLRKVDRRLRSIVDACWPETAGNAVLSAYLGSTRGSGYAIRGPIFSLIYTALPPRDVHIPAQRAQYLRDRQITSALLVAATCAVASLPPAPSSRLMELGVHHLLIPALLRPNALVSLRLFETTFDRMLPLAVAMPPMLRFLYLRTKNAGGPPTRNFQQLCRALPLGLEELHLQVAGSLPSDDWSALLGYLPPSLQILTVKEGDTDSATPAARAAASLMPWPCPARDLVEVSLDADGYRTAMHDGHVAYLLGAQRQLRRLEMVVYRPEDRRPCEPTQLGNIFRTLREVAISASYGFLAPSCLPALFQQCEVLMLVNAEMHVDEVAPILATKAPRLRKLGFSWGDWPRASLVALARDSAPRLTSITFEEFDLWSPLESVKFFNGTVSARKLALGDFSELESDG